MSALDDLVAVMPPQRRVAAPATWLETERVLGVRFPVGYKALLDTYGQCSIGGELGLVDPRRHAFWLSWTNGSLAGVDDVYADGEAPFPAFPSSVASLLPVGGNGNFDTVFLVVEGEAALEESVWVGNVRNHDWVQTPGSLTDLLLRVVTTGASDLEAVFGWPWRLTAGLAQSD